MPAESKCCPRSSPARVRGCPNGEARIVDRLVDEGDVAVAATRVLTATGLLRDDAIELPPAMKSAYAEMRAEQGDAPSPLLGTYLGLQRTADFDLVVIDPPKEGERAGATPDADVIFLHGFAGFDLPCWEMARAVGALGVVTASCSCARPSTTARYGTSSANT